MSVEATIAINSAAQMVAAAARPVTDTHTLLRFLVHIEDHVKEINAALEAPGAALSGSYLDNLRAVIVLESARLAVISAIERRKPQETEAEL